MSASVSKPQAKSPSKDSLPTYLRFNVLQRIEHLVLILSFSTLAITGLPQKFPTAGLSQAVIAAYGGIEAIRIVHHAAAVVMIVQSIYHVIVAAYALLVKGVPATMMPGVQDARHILEAVQYYVGKRKHPPRYGRYTYAEKMEYWAMVWGTVVMALTGFILWNPITTTRWLPGELVPAAKAAHGAEAVLAVLAILLWHFYHVHLKHLNLSIFTGHLDEHEMREEHPAELAHLKAGHVHQPPAPEVVRKRQRVFFPVAFVLTVAALAGMYLFLTSETSALTTIPYDPNLETAYVPATPTPTPIPTDTPTPAPAPAGTPASPPTGGGGGMSFSQSILPILQLKCGVCHGQAGGLTLTTYESIIQGGANGPAVVPGDADNSLLVKKAKGGHPGQLSAEEMALIAEWIKAGAPK